MTATTPVIGVTPCSRLDDYLHAVERAGGRPRVLAIGESPRALIDLLDGVLLTGGGDVDPAFYGEERHHTVDDAEPGRDEFEIDLTRRARDAGLPLLGICRGVQVLNVASGGSLVQDIPSHVGETVGHSLQQPRNAEAHPIAVEDGSRLARALGGDAGLVVNSRHHQSIGRLAAGLHVTATAPDGVIEAVEANDDAFCLGVQWHPENFWKTGEFGGLFDAFVEAARRRREERPTP